MYSIHLCNCVKILVFDLLTYSNKLLVGRISYHRDIHYLTAYAFLTETKIKFYFYILTPYIQYTINNNLYGDEKGIV